MNARTRKAAVSYRTARPPTKKTAVFLDRDGTLNFDPGYLNRPEQFRFLPRVKTALKMLSQNGLELFVISNQSGVGRGLVSRDNLEKIHRKMLRELRRNGVSLGGIFVCPHRPDEQCACRKPSPNLILKAARRHRLNLWNSFMVGDKLSDVEAGLRAGLQTVLVRHHRAHPDAVIRPNHVARDLFGAARWIIQRHKVLEAGKAA